MKALRIGVAWIFALLAGFGALTAQAAESPPDAVDAVYALGPDISGTWYDPAQNGQGFVIQHIVSNGQPALLATWFTYLDGKARWLIGVGTPSGSGASIPLSITTGADFPPRFVAASAVGSSSAKRKASALAISRS